MASEPESWTEELGTDALGFRGVECSYGYRESAQMGAVVVVIDGRRQPAAAHVTVTISGKATDADARVLIEAGLANAKGAYSQVQPGGLGRWL